MSTMTTKMLTMSRRRRSSSSTRGASPSPTWSPSNASTSSSVSVETLSRTFSHFWTLSTRKISALFCCRILPESSPRGDRQRAVTVPSHSQVLATIRVKCVSVPFFSPHLNPETCCFESNGSLQSGRSNLKPPLHQHCYVCTVYTVHCTNLIITSVLIFRLVGFEMGLMLICLFFNNPEAQVHSFNS